MIPFRTAVRAAHTAFTDFSSRLVLMSAGPVIVTGTIEVEEEEEEEEEEVAAAGVISMKQISFKQD